MISTITPTLTPLQQAELNLGNIPGVRIEWSLKISRQGITPRQQVILWVGKKGDSGNSKAFKAMQNLLIDLDCPEQILCLQEKLSDLSAYQGVKLSFTDRQNSGCFYVNYCDTEIGKEIKSAYSWNERSQLTITDYSFHAFSGRPAPAFPVGHIHPDLAAAFRKLLEDEKLIEKSGYWMQEQNGCIKEIYITYPWHPTVGSIFNTIKGYLPGIEAADLSEYRADHFRHIGFSATSENIPVITIYFCAPLQGPWPQNCEDIRQKTQSAGVAVHQKLMKIIYNQ